MGTGWFGGHFFIARHADKDPVNLYPAGKNHLAQEWKILLFFMWIFCYNVIHENTTYSD